MSTQIYGGVNMKKLGFIFIIAAFIFSCFTSYAADVNNGLNDRFVGNTKPVITGKTVDYHIRVLEFVLGTRMTLAQKQIFMKAIEEESKNMDTEQLTNLADVNELADSLNLLSDEDAEPIRQLLERDFNATVASLEGQNDLAANQYKNVRANLAEKIVETRGVTVTRQSVEAFAEYLAFVADTKKPIWPGELSKDATIMRIKTNFAKYTEDERAALEDFQLTWYLIRAAWQTADVKTKARWQKSFDKLGLKPGKDVTSANIKAALSTEVYTDLLDFATQAGIEPIEWSAKTKASIW